MAEEGSSERKDAESSGGYLGLPKGFMPGCEAPTAEQIAERKRWKELDDAEQKRLKDMAKALRKTAEAVWTEEDENARWCEDEDGPYRINATGGWSLNEMLSHPLFFKPDMIPSDPADFEKNYPLIAALRDMYYEGESPEAMAEKFNQIGGEKFKVDDKAATMDALIAYSKALEMESSDKKANSKYLANRAATSMKLKQYDKAVDDCIAATDLNPENIKAWFRGAQCCENLGLFSRAHRMVCKALELAPEDSATLRLHERLVKRIERKAKIDAAEKEKERQRQAEAIEKEKQVLESMQSSNITLGLQLYDVSKYKQQCFPRLDQEGDFEWPLIFLYEEYGQTDFVEFWNVLVPLEHLMQQMFPGDRFADWDEHRTYSWNNLAVYLEVFIRDGRTDTEYLCIDLQRAPLEYILGRQVSPCLPLHVFVKDHPCHIAWRKRKDL